MKLLFIMATVAWKFNDGVSYLLLFFELRECVFEDAGRELQCFLLLCVKVKFEGGLDSTISDDACSAKGYIAQPILSGHQG